MIRNTIKFEKDTVTKVSTPKLMGIEVEKTLRAYKIGVNCQLFRVPRVVDYDNIKGEARFERIYEISPIRDVLIRQKNPNSLIKQIGAALAVIHRELILPKEMTLELPCELRQPGTEVFLHGDFNGINVCYVPTVPTIVILDWQMTFRYSGNATYGSRYFDLIWFINYLLLNPSFANFFNDPTNRLANLFLESYFNEAEIHFDRESFLQYCKIFFKTNLLAHSQYQHRKKQLILPYSHFLIRKFLMSIG